MGSLGLESVSPKVQAVVEDPQFNRLKALVIEATGMAFYTDKNEELARIIQSRLSETGIGDCAAYIDHLGGDEMDLLVAELTIGETYFFRHKEQFDAFRDVILPGLLERNQDTRRLRIWSAGCATGPEPYSLAILLKREFGPRLAGWQVSIVATDINQKFLSRAREGRYDEWAFRTIPDDVLRDCFDKSGRQWVIKPEYKRVVTFQHHNLIKNRFPSLIDNIAGFDIIICRNVIIYFSRETIEALIPCFRDSLNDGGWLVMGHAEPNMELFRNFRTVTCPGAILYQKADIAPVEQRPPPQSAAPIRTVAPLVPARKPAAPRPPVSRQPSPPTPTSGRSTSLDAARALADSGRWQESIDATNALLASTPLDPAIHFFRALVLEQMGNSDECEKALRRAIYLDRRMVLPHYHLGLFLWRRNDSQGAARSFRNVLGLLDDLADNATFPDGDDMTAGQLRETVLMQLKLIGAA